MLCWFLPYINMTQSQVCIRSFPTEAPSQPILPLQVVTEHQVEFPILISNFPLAVCFTNGNIYSSLLLSQFLAPSVAFYILQETPVQGRAENGYGKYCSSLSDDWSHQNANPLELPGNVYLNRLPLWLACLENPDFCTSGVFGLFHYKKGQNINDF